MNLNTEKSVDAHGNEHNSKVTNALKKGSKHDANLRKNGILNFQIGLIIAMLLVYGGLEASFMKFEPFEKEMMPEISEVVEFYPETNNPKVEKPKQEVKAQKTKVVNPTEFEVIDDKSADKLEDVIMTDTEVDPDEEIDAGGIVYEEIVDTPIVPFDVVEDAPIFPGCEKVKEHKRAECFNKKMNRHINKHFRYPDAAMELEQQGRVRVLFKIGVDGTITDVQMQGPSGILEKEAGRIIGKLPKMIPGKQRGTPVIVPYSVPITFKLH